MRTQIYSIRTTTLIVTLIVSSSAWARIVEYDATAPFKFLGWSKDSTHIFRARKADDGKMIVTACPVGTAEDKCKILCEKKRCAVSGLASVKKMGLVKPRRPALVFNRVIDSSRRPRTKKRLRARIPTTRLQVKLGKLAGAGFNKCYPLFVGKKKLTCLAAAPQGDGIDVHVYLAPGKKAVALKVVAHAEHSPPMRDLIALPLK